MKTSKKETDNKKAQADMPSTDKKATAATDRSNAKGERDDKGMTAERDAANEKKNTKNR